MARHFESDPNESTALRFEQRGAQASAQTGAPASQLGAKQNAYLSGDLGKDSSKGAGKKPGKKKRSISSIISNLMLVIGIVLLAVAGCMWGKAQWDYHEQDKTNQKLATYAQLPEKGGPPKVDWKGLKAVNKDVVGWIQVPHTVINYPVYQGASNDTYLNTTAEGVHGVGGQIFLDYENKKPGMLDQQTLIYGHHLKNGTMFKQIADMDKQEFFNSIDTLWYVTETGIYELEPLFLYYTTGEDTTVRQFNFENEEAFQNFLKEKLAKAQTKRKDAEKLLPSVKHVLSLGTCDYIEGYGRTILVCAIKSEVHPS